MTLRSMVERKCASLPRFITVPAEVVCPWEEVAVGGTDIGRRTLKHRGRERDVWFFDLNEAQCRAAGIDTGDEVTVRQVTEHVRAAARSETRRRRAQRRLLDDPEPGSEGRISTRKPYNTG